MSDDQATPAPLLCPRCARESTGDFRFCPYCGAMLEAVVAPLLERRRVVVLFCDLVASTALAASLDPEQVQATLSAYHRAARARIESYGGTVEKFVGDAVMAVFGAPHAHEDDAERAVGAALDVLADVAAQRAPDGTALVARIGIHLGETAVTVTADVSGGEAYVAGDVVNAAARLQTLAEPGTVVVSAPVAEAAGARFELEEREPQRVKGIAEPLEHWRVLGPTRRALPARMPDLVDRTVELPLLEALLAEVVEQRSARMVSISGAPGMGKSRLVHELSTRAAARDDGVRWLTGGCLPYGDGITFWALAEVLKELAGVLDSDRADLVREKVEALLPGDGEAAWLRSRLLPLLGVDSSPVERHELFAAWTRALELAAAARPTVVVLEDLHWADPAMLDFVEHVHDQHLEVPLLVVLTFRSQLLSRRPSWTGWSSPSLELAPLTAEETEQLMTADLDAGDLAPETMAAFLERADGNPLFAQEFARLLRDREAAGSSGPGADASLPVPTSVHALVGARLDVLSLSERVVVRDASVVGRVFWSGAVAAMSDQSTDVVERVLDSLVDKGVVLAHPESSMGGEREYSFGHAVLRDVAYERASRSRRLEAHLVAMRWIEHATEGRVDEVAEVLVHHASTALDLAELSGAVDEQAAARTATRRYAIAAARRALGLDPGRALLLVDLARGLGDDGVERDPEVLLLWGRAALVAGRIREAREPMLSCVAWLREHGRGDELVDALVVLGNVHYQLGETADGLAADQEAVEVARSSAPARLPFVTSNLAMTYAALADPAGLALADEEVDRAEAAGQAPQDIALRARATLRLMAGDARGLDDHDRAIELISRSGSSPMALAYAMNGRVEGVWAVRGPVEAVAAADETIAFMRARGVENAALDGGQPAPAAAGDGTTA
ncbi:MAG: adenylate/guanylate cyclase domain-containing protein [Candidatus Nanopelagicales bacterium]